MLGPAVAAVLRWLWSTSGGRHNSGSVYELENETSEQERQRYSRGFGERV